MKKYLVICLLALILVTVGQTPTYAVYNVRDSKNIAQAVKQVAYQYQQVQMQLKNLSDMDSTTATANMGTIQENISQLVSLHQQTQGIISDYQDFQNEWNSVYGSENGINALDYLGQVQNHMQTTERQIQIAMQNQAYARSQMPTTAKNLNDLLIASQNADGSLAAAQAGNQIAAIQAQQMMTLIQILSTQHDAQMSYQAQQKNQQEMSQQFHEEFFESSERTTEEAAGMPNF